MIRPMSSSGFTGAKKNWNTSTRNMRLVNPAGNVGQFVKDVTPRIPEAEVARARLLLPTTPAERIRALMPAVRAGSARRVHYFPMFCSRKRNILV